MTWLHLLAAIALISSIYWVPFFGTQAVRLLRESWGGILRKDPEGDYVEQGASELAQELYAMFDDNIPQTQNAPVTFNVTNPLGPGITINNPNGGNSFNINGGNTNIGGNTNNGDVITIGGGTFNTATNTFDFGGNTITINKNGITFGDPNFPTLPAIPGQPPLPPITINNPTNFVGPANFAQPPTVPGGGGGGGGSGGTSVFLGKVTGGTGNSYQVDLYGNGSSAPKTKSVTATVPQLDSRETIPVGIWVSAVFEFAHTTGVPGEEKTTFTYEFQCPLFIYG